MRGYKRLFTHAIVNAIEKQPPECLFANWQGVMIGHGAVWFEEQPNGTMKIKTLNIPISNRPTTELRHVAFELPAPF